MRKMKDLLCVLLTMIISLGSMVTVKADTEIKPYENKENAVLLKREYIDLDEDTVIEIESYEEKNSVSCKSWMENHISHKDLPGKR